MQKLTKFGETTTDLWQFVNKDEATKTGVEYQLLPLSQFLTCESAWIEKNLVAPWIDGDDDLSLLKDLSKKTAFIAIYFPKFADGRGFSLARMLREQYSFSGEICAVGYFMQDQLHFLARCGFDTFSTTETTDIESMKLSLKDFSEHYQAACDQPLPLFRRAR